MADRGATNPEVTLLVVDFLSFKLNQIGFQWSCPRVAPEAGLPNSSKVVASLCSLSEEFSSQYKDNFVQMCERLEVSESNLKPALVGIADELFSEGIKWSRIVALLVFGSELAIHCQSQNEPQLIEAIAHSLSAYISEKLLPWIEDHGGWEGLVRFKEGSGPVEGEVWSAIRNVMCIGIGTIGALTLGAFLSKS